MLYCNNITLGLAEVYKEVMSENIYCAISIVRISDQVETIMKTKLILKKTVIVFTAFIFVLVLCHVYFTYFASIEKRIRTRILVKYRESSCPYLYGAEVYMYKTPNMEHLKSYNFYYAYASCSNAIGVVYIYTTYIAAQKTNDNKIFIWKGDDIENEKVFNELVKKESILLNAKEYVDYMAEILSVLYPDLLFIIPGEKLYSGIDNILNCRQRKEECTKISEQLNKRYPFNKVENNMYEVFSRSYRGHMTKWQVSLEDDGSIHFKKMQDYDGFSRLFE